MKPALIFNPWKKIRKELIDMVDLFSEDELDFQPFPDSWSVGKTFLHIAETEDYWIHYLVRKELPGDLHYELKEFPSLRAVKSKLAVSHERTQKFMDSLNEPDLDWKFKLPNGTPVALYSIFWHVLEHEIHHRGEISLALGMLGKKGLDV
jgi:uncharacterized damage-inducible protein DinB